MQKRDLSQLWFLLGFVSVVAAILSWAWQSGRPFLQLLRCLLDHKLTDTITALLIGLATGAAAVFNRGVPSNLGRVLQSLYGGIASALFICVLVAGIFLSPLSQKECLPIPSHTSTPFVRPISTVKATPTRTLTPTPRPPTPTHIGDNCSWPVGERFGGIWNAIQKRPSEKTRLECPLSDAHAEYGVAQKFEHGYMLWRDGQDLVYVLYQDGDASIIYEKYRQDMDPEKIGYAPPPGLQEPIRGFGKVWREHLGGLSARIGWATEHEYVAPNLVVQDFKDGMIFWEDCAGNRVFFSLGWWEQW